MFRIVPSMFNRATFPSQRSPLFFGYWLIAAAFVAQFVSVGVSFAGIVLTPVMTLIIDRLNAKSLAAAGAAITGIAMLIIVFSVQMRADLWVYGGFFLLGCGWGGMIPLQEVIWASFFGRRYLGAVRSAALPFSFLISAGAPLGASYYFDSIGNYDGVLLAVAASNLLSAVLLLLIPTPRKHLVTPA